VNLFWPILYLLASLFVIVVPAYASPYETGYGCLMILTSVPVYFIFIAWKNKPKSFQKAMGEYYKIENLFFVVCHYQMP
jgi:solute carrier family 7 L-type amino acid transporter-like protein